MEIIPNPHDRFIRSLFSDPEEAASLLQVVLPSAIASTIDWNSLELQDGSFVSPELQETQSDLLFRVAVGDDSPLYVYLLFEHKSYADRATYVQMLGYLQQIFLRQQSDGNLMPVLPLVLYHGVADWPLPVNFAGQFILSRMPADIRDFLPSYDHILIDVQRLDLAPLLLSVAARAGLQLLQAIRADDFADKIPAILNPIADLVNEEKKLAVLRRCLRYIAGASDIPIENLHAKLHEITWDGGMQDMMTLERRLIEQGKLEGKKEGKLEARLETARKLTARNMSLSDICDIAGLTEQQLRDHGILR